MNAPTLIKSAMVTFLVAVALLFAGDAPFASAAGSLRTTAALGIGVRVDTRCVVIVSSDVVFPSTYQSNQAAPLDAEGALYVDCDPGRRASLRLDQGLHPAPGSTDRNPLRRMADATGTRFINYNLYENAARTKVWDDDRPGVKTTRAWPVIMPVYARVFGGQTVYTGTYTDTITANLFF